MAHLLGLFPRLHPEEVEARSVEVRWRDVQERPVELWVTYQLFAFICLRFLHVYFADDAQDGSLSLV